MGSQTGAALLLLLALVLSQGALSVSGAVVSVLLILRRERHVIKRVACFNAFPNMENENQNHKPAAAEDKDRMKIIELEINDEDLELSSRSEESDSDDDEYECEESEETAFQT